MATLTQVLVFTARLTEKAMMESEFMRVHNIVDWCCQYFVYNMFDEWIVSSGGWVRYPPINITHTQYQKRTNYIPSVFFATQPLSSLTLLMV